MKPRRGFRMAINEEIFSDILCKAMGLEPGTIRVVQAATFGWNNAVEICALTDDERFPEVKEGEQFPEIMPSWKFVPVENADGSKRYEIHFDGFMECKM